MERFYKRYAQRLHGKPTPPIRCVRWCMDYEQKRMRLFRAHGSKSKTRAGRIWRLFWRLKRYTATQAERKEK